MSAWPPERRPLLCAVTDRRRLVPGGGEPAAIRECLLRQARFAIEAEVDLFQIRERDLEARELYDLTVAIVAAARGSRTKIVVNDRLDVALVSHADGVHLRTDSIPPPMARRIAPPGFLVGRSVHGVEEARACAGDVDYLVAGTVFVSRSKPGGPLLGPAGLAAVAAAVPVPVLAIGGISPGHAGRLAASGAAGAAGIDLFLDRGPLPDADGCRATPLDHLAAFRRAWFDSAGRAS